MKNWNKSFVTIYVLLILLLVVVYSILMMLADQKFAHEELSIDYSKQIEKRAQYTHQELKTRESLGLVSHLKPMEIRTRQTRLQVEFQSTNYPNIIFKWQCRGFFGRWCYYKPYYSHMNQEDVATLSCFIDKKALNDGKDKVQFISLGNRAKNIHYYIDLFFYVSKGTFLISFLTFIYLGIGLYVLIKPIGKREKFEYEEYGTLPANIKYNRLEKITFVICFIMPIAYFLL